MGSAQKLLSRARLGEVEVANRVVLAPLTRGRASEDHVPSELMAKYYAQRAEAGLLIAEATGISQQGLGWYRAPGIWSSTQVEAWKATTQAVHKADGKIFLQLWHMGRQGHSDVFKTTPVSASAIPLTAPITTNKGEKKDPETPHALTEGEVKQVVQDYAKAAANAKAAGFDGVEIHSANGYLVDQFFQSKTNKREDSYGGSVENRLRFFKEIVEEITKVFPAGRVGARFSPNGVHGEMGSEDNVETFTEAIKYAASQNLAYVHLMDGLGFGFHKLHEPFTAEQAREIINGARSSTALMANVGYTRESAEEKISKGVVDVVAFGRDFITNPDLVARFRDGLPLEPRADRKLWFSFDSTAEGYTTWPTHDANRTEEKRDN